VLFDQGTDVVAFELRIGELEVLHVDDPVLLADLVDELRDLVEAAGCLQVRDCLAVALTDGRNAGLPERIGAFASVERYARLIGMIEHKVNCLAQIKAGLMRAGVTIDEAYGALGAVYPKVFSIPEFERWPVVLFNGIAKPILVE